MVSGLAWPRREAAVFSPTAAPADVIVLPSSKTSAGTRFTRDQRVRKSADHGRVWKNGKRLYVGPLVVVACIGSTPHARMGTAISKRAFRRAVQRNRVKRLIRESFRQVAGQLPAMDIVISISTRKPMRDESSLLRALDKTWRTLSDS